jgi:hypothetical protein
VADILTAADIAELRREWVVDEIDEHPEWGSGGSKVATLAAAGAASVALTGLGTGTLKRGTPFTIRTGTTEVRYTVAADVAIVATAATVSISPLLKQAVAVNDVVTVEPFYRSVFNRVFGRLFFSDVELEDLARRAEERWGQRIHEANDPRRMRFRAIGLLAVTEKLDSTEYEASVIQLENQDGGRGHFDRLEKRRAEWESEVARKTTGHSNGVLTR